MVDQSNEDISDCKGLRGVAMATKFWPKNHKNGHNFTCKRHIHTKFGFEIGFVHREFIFDTPVHKGQRGVTMTTNFGTKIAINAYKCISMKDSENVITYNGGFSWSTNPKKTFLIARV